MTTGKGHSIIRYIKPVLAVHHSSIFYVFKAPQNVQNASMWPQKPSKVLSNSNV